jgi:creatinine amidohydrolase
MHLTDLNWPAIEGMSKDVPVVFPIAALEQHGLHLPLFTDSLLLGEIIRRAAGRLSGRVLFAPLLWLGNSDHHLDFPGTLSAPPRAYLDMLGGLLENFIRHGFRRLVFVNGHGGNEVPGQQVIFELRQRYRDRHDLLLLFATYWQLADLGKNDDRFQQKQMGHACEWETSMILRVAPKLVGPLDRLEPVRFGHAFEPASRGWTTKDRTVSGHIGDPRSATAEKGETLFRLFADGVVELLERVIRWDGKSWK